MKRGISAIRATLLGILLLGGVSCSRDYLEPAPIKTGEGLRLSLGSSTISITESDAILDGMRLYSFAQDGTAGSGYSGSFTSHFHHMVAGVTHTAGSMSLITNQMRVGRWDMVIVAPQGADFTPPIAAKSAGELLMYTFDPTLNNGSAHQFYYRFHRLPEITVDNNHSISTGISRNVAKIQIVVDRAVDVSTDSRAIHTIQLNKVPSRISWAGTLLRTDRGKYQTDVSGFDMLPNGTLTGDVTFSAATETGTFKSNTLEFVIPAHRGTDFWDADGLTQNLTPVDTITQKMEVLVSFTKASGGTFTKTVEIPVVARCNSILVAHLKMQDTNLEVITKVDPWTTKDVEGDVGAPYLNVSELETTVYDGTASRVYFWSNQPTDVYVSSMGKDSQSTPIDISTIFTDLAGIGASNCHYTYNAATKSGEGYIDILNSEVTSGTIVRKIYLNAGGAKREIVVTSQPVGRVK